MPRLVLVNGAPGSGKSTVAQAVARETSMMLAWDIDALKHSLGRWDEEPSASGLHARRLTLALAAEQLHAGFDLVMGQYLPRTAFIDELERLAERHGARFHEFVLELDAASLAKRLAERARQPDRFEHAVNNRLVGPADAAALVQAIESLHEARPRALWVDATGSLSSTLETLRAALVTPGQL
jgi:predicted kinase